MNRRQAREYALKMLFQHDFVGNRTSPECAGDQWFEQKANDDLRKFARELVSGTLKHLEEIDRVVQEAAEHWDMGRMAAVDRNILRCAVYEILFKSDIPAAVTINEALEIAKKYSSLESVSFINGLLDKIAHINDKSK
jgi:transcription antitermination protein NusB